MKPENIQFLETHRGVHTMLVKAGIVKQLDSATRQGILNVIREEWDPGHNVSLWCGDCVSSMIAYAYTQFDKYLEAQSRIVAMTFPVQEPPVTDTNTERTTHTVESGSAAQARLSDPPEPDPPNDAPVAPIRKPKKRR